MEDEQSTIDKAGVETQSSDEINNFSESTITPFQRQHLNGHSTPIDTEGMNANDGENDHEYPDQNGNENADVKDHENDNENADEKYHENTDEKCHENFDVKDNENADENDHENVDVKGHENADNSDHENVAVKYLENTDKNDHENVDKKNRENTDENNHGNVDEKNRKNTDENDHVDVKDHENAHENDYDNVDVNNHEKSAENDNENDDVNDHKNYDVNDHENADENDHEGDPDNDENNNVNNAENNIERKSENDDRPKPLEQGDPGILTPLTSRPTVIKPDYVSLNDFPVRIDDNAENIDVINVDDQHLNDPEQDVEQSSNDSDSSDPVGDSTEPLEEQKVSAINESSKNELDENQQELNPPTLLNSQSDDANDGLIQANIAEAQYATSQLTASENFDQVPQQIYQVQYSANDLNSNSNYDVGIQQGVYPVQYFGQMVTQKFNPQQARTLTNQQQVQHHGGQMIEYAPDGSHESQQYDNTVIQHQAGGTMTLHAQQQQDGTFEGFLPVTTESDGMQGSLGQSYCVQYTTQQPQGIGKQPARIVNGKKIGVKPVNPKFDRSRRFPEKLYAVACDPEIDFIRWSASGKAIIVNEKEFELQVMTACPGLVQSDAFDNFRRQLREYTFECRYINMPFAFDYEFIHPQFQYQREDLLSTIKTRRRQQRVSLVEEGHIGDEPPRKRRSTKRKTVQAEGSNSCGNLNCSHQHYNQYSVHHTCNNHGNFPLAQWQYAGYASGDAPCATHMYHSNCGSMHWPVSSQSSPGSGQRLQHSHSNHGLGCSHAGQTPDSTGSDRGSEQDENSKDGQETIWTQQAQQQQQQQQMWYPTANMYGGWYAAQQPVQANEGEVQDESNGQGTTEDSNDGEESNSALVAQAHCIDPDKQTDDEEDEEDSRDNQENNQPDLVEIKAPVVSVQHFPLPEFQGQRLLTSPIAIPLQEGCQLTQENQNYRIIADGGAICRHQSDNTLTTLSIAQPVSTPTLYTV